MSDKENSGLSSRPFVDPGCFSVLLCLFGGFLFRFLLFFMVKK
jgi:hypothetical protein